MKPQVIVSLISAIFLSACVAVPRFEVQHPPIAFNNFSSPAPVAQVMTFEDLMCCYECQV